MDQANRIKLLFLLAQLVADLTAPTANGPGFTAVHALTGCKSLEAILGPRSGAQAPMARADLLAGYRGFTAVALLPGNEGLAASAVSVWPAFGWRILG